MPRVTVNADNQEGRLSDSMFDDWKVVTQDRGTKIVFGAGKDETQQFVGVYLGTEIVNLSDDEGSTNPLDTATAVLFTNLDGERYWCWTNYTITKAIEDGTILNDDTVMIKYTGTSPTKRGLNPVKTFEIRVKPRQ